MNIEAHILIGVWMARNKLITASRELELTLTGKDCGQEERAPMCGIPYHAAETYVAVSYTHLDVYKRQG